MSDITKLTDKIIADAREKKQKIVAAITMEMQTYEQQQERASELAYQTELAEFEKELRRKLQQRISKQHIVLRNKLLQDKQELLQLVYQEAIGQLRALDAATFLQFATQVIQTSGLLGDITVQIGEYSIAVCSQAVQNKLQQACQPKQRLHFVAKTIPDHAGLILVQDGIEINVTFEALLQSLQDEMTGSILSVLFPES